jgi:ubiquinone/menaquinone biosynthesis C-methylase UbiE
MQAAEYEKLDRIDANHWFYRGKRAIVRYFIHKHIKLTKEDRLVDAGTGTGRWPVEMSKDCTVIGLDDHEESVQLARPKIESVGGQVLQTPLNRIPLADGSAAVVTAMDVLEHLKDDASALRELIRLIRPGGLIIITVPALRMLWSDWDVVLHHYRRYQWPDFHKLVSQPGISVVHMAYTNFFALPLILLIRMLRKLFPLKPGAERAEDRIPSKPINAILYALYVYPAIWRWPLPVGVSLLAVLRKQ